MPLLTGVAPAADPAARPRLTDYYRVNKGGGLFSEATGQWLGAALAAAGHRLGLAPTALTLINLALGLATSVAVILLAGPVAAGTVPAWLVGVVALVGWQLAYAFDCADGQLARATGQTSVAGARTDILCDVASQIALVTAIATVAVAQQPATPVWLVAVFVGGWMVNLVTSALQSGPNAASMVPSRSLPVRVVKLIRDPGAIFFLAALLLIVAPALMVWFVAAFAAINGGFLLASIAFAARSTTQAG
ncbi:CDP-alcohol phosphatidyltransferase family protein [Natronosporangium hydrolyticum]|uniref:CDP-alcohol phosphatidyltransferase family protein n=1 Tax=Natronosporangium hydrolyticum TaxID=2811111 RepID=A0A895YB50_9ACTN|nr:CDP-alcohol phosphatidyltransferase family protein [Natronosporangium hydrolyticum]QSB14977.1 CDP-alcohol phosphatidyltransferase family protein [Natronosporangium hydrolyticum]